LPEKVISRHFVSPKSAAGEPFRWAANTEQSSFICLDYSEPMFHSIFSGYSAKWEGSTGAKMLYKI
jgi:hypothetical protein